MSKATREKFGLPPLGAPRPAAAITIEGHGHDKGARVDAVVIAPPAGAVWNGIRRLWMVDGVAVEPQPAPPLVVSFSLDSGRHYGPAAALPPAVKVSA